MKCVKGKIILRFIFVLAVTFAIEEENFATSHVAIDIKQILKTIIDLLNQCVLMKKYSKTPANEELCQHVARNVS